MMFSDLVRSTALAARMDPEDLREIVSAYQKCVAETVGRFGGFVAKYLGDGVLIYFGYPHAHEDDAERAVRAGLELIGAVGALKAVSSLQTRRILRPVSPLNTVGRSMKSPRLKLVKSTEMRPVAARGRQPNEAYRVREHLTEDEMARLLVALKRNRHGRRDWLLGLLIYRHGLRVSEACDLRWDDIDLPKRTIIVRRLKGSTDSTHYLERDEHKALGDLRRAYAAKGIKSDYVFVNERGEPFGRMGIARKIEHAGEAAGLPFPIHVHMLRHSTGYASAAKGMGTRRREHFLFMPASPDRPSTATSPTVSRTCGAARARRNRPQNAANASEQRWTAPPALSRTDAEQAFKDARAIVGA